ncbi:MAG: lipopolysaccharide biosynthesis protein RfbH [Rhodomicrobiaceae bacterium]
MNKDDLKKEILTLVGQYGDLTNQQDIFEKGKSPIPPSGKVIGSKELRMMVDSVLDGWLTTGRFNDAFELKLKEFIGIKHVLTTNSGSSANLLAISALTSPKLGDRRLKPGDEVITVAAGFPTTVNPIIQNGLIPVFVDVDISTYNINTDLLNDALSEKTKAIMIAHTLGNPFDLKNILKFVNKHNLWLIEDCCDALGSTYTLNDEDCMLSFETKLNKKAKKYIQSSNLSTTRPVGTFGHIGTLSFYPAHHITMGEGGAVFTNSGELKPIIESIRDWGRDCFCQPGEDNTCNKRFSWKLGDLPQGYDHKYIYSHLGYNLKITDMQAAAGLAQMDRLENFIQTRKENFTYLNERLQSLSKHLILPMATKNSNPSWFGFPITLVENENYRRTDLIKYLDHHKIGTRMLFAGNLTKQPYFKDLKYKIAGNLINTDTIMNQTFWLGVYPALSHVHLDFVADKLEDFFREKLNV